MKLWKLHNFIFFTLYLTGCSGIGQISSFVRHQFDLSFLEDIDILNGMLAQIVFVLEVINRN